MSVAVDETIYKTEVVKVSEMPEAELLNPAALFLVAQYNRSKKVQFKTIENQIQHTLSANISSDIESIHDNLNTLASKIDDLDSSTEQKIEDTKTEFDSKLRSTANALSNSLTSDYDARFKKSDESFFRLKLFVDNQDLPSLRAADRNLKNSLDQQAMRIDNLEKKEATDVQNLTSKITNDIDAAKTSVLDQAQKSLDKAIDSTKQWTEAEIKNAKKDLGSKISELSAKESHDIQALGEADSKLKTEVNDVSSILSSAIADLNSTAEDRFKIHENQISSISATAEIGYQTAIKSADHADELDIKLYGVNVEQLNDNNQIETVQLSVGDIETLSSEIDALDQKQTDLNSDLQSLSTALGSLFKTEIVNSGPYQIQSQKDKILGISIKKDGYMPFAILEVKLKDKNNIEFDNVIPLARYIYSSEEGRVQVQNNMETTQDVFMHSTIMYIKSM